MLRPSLPAMDIISPDLSRTEPRQCRPCKALLLPLLRRAGSAPGPDVQGSPVTAVASHGTKGNGRQRSGIAKLAKYYICTKPESPCPHQTISQVFHTVSRVFLSLWKHHWCFLLEAWFSTNCTRQSFIWKLAPEDLFKEETLWSWRPCCHQLPKILLHEVQICQPSGGTVPFPGGTVMQAQLVNWWN